MKKISPILFLFYSLSSLAQEPVKTKYDSLKEKNPQLIRTIVKTNPTALMIGVMPLVTSEYRLLLEFPSAPMQSSQVGFSYLGKGWILSLAENDSLKKNPNAYLLKIHVSGYRFQASYRFFFNEWMHASGISRKPIYAPRGFYLSPHVSYATAKVTYKFMNQYDIYFRVNHFNVNLLLGCQFTMGKLTVDGFAGLGYKQNQWFMRNQNIIKQIPPPKEFENFGYNSPLKITVAMNFGWSF